MDGLPEGLRSMGGVPIKTSEASVEVLLDERGARRVSPSNSCSNDGRLRFQRSNNSKSANVNTGSALTGGKRCPALISLAMPMGAPCLNQTGSSLSGSPVKA